MYVCCVQRVHASLEEGAQADGVGTSWAGPSEEEPAYRLLVDCNQLAVRRSALTGSDAYDVDFYSCNGCRNVCVLTCTAPAQKVLRACNVAGLDSAAAFIKCKCTLTFAALLLRLDGMRCDNRRLHLCCAWQNTASVQDNCGMQDGSLYHIRCRPLSAPLSAQVDIDAEIAVVHNFMRDHYRAKFPELESLVHHAVDYARVVRAIGNEMDLTLVDLEDILPQARWALVCVCAEGLC